MTDWVERCEAVNPADGALCQLPKGHTGKHSPFAPPPQASHIIPPTAPVYAPPQPRRNNSNGAGCLVIIVILIAAVTCSRLTGNHSAQTASTSSTSAPEAEGALQRKAPSSAREAANQAFLSDEQRVEYSAGLSHIKKTGGHVGTYTIGQVLALGATPIPAPTRDPYIGVGDPSCLKLLSQHGNDDGMAIHITGSVVNTCGQDFGYVEITFQVENANGAAVGDALANALHIDAGQTWNYNAIGTSVGGQSTFRMTQLTGH